MQASYITFLFTCISYVAIHDKTTSYMLALVNHKSNKVNYFKLLSHFSHTFR